MTQNLAIEEFSYSGNSVSAAVCISPPNLIVNDKLASTILALRPTLREHVCKQKGFGTFGDKIVNTSLPHLVEHLAIDLLVQELEPLPAPIAGATRWLNRAQGQAQIRISCTPQTAQATRQALISAVAQLNQLL